MNRKTMTVLEAADYLGVCKDTIYTMVRTGEIPHFRLRRRIFFTKEKLDSWISEQEADQQSQVI